MAKSPSVTQPTPSGGPQTVEGKKIASQNALKTGAYSNTLILPGEDESDYRQIEDQFVRDFRPEDMAEIAMVRDLAVLAWKKIRLENLELRFTLARLNEPLGYFDKQDTEYLSSDRVESNLHRLSSYSAELKKEVGLAISYLKGVQSRGATIEELEALEEAYPLIHELLVKHINHYEFTNPTAKNVLRYEIENDDGKTELFWSYFLREAAEDLQKKIWFCDSRPKIEKELQVVKDRRLMELMQNEKPSRAFDDLRRNFYRTLGELRKHQEWKRKMQVVDVASRNVVDSGEEGTSD
jgi:ferritin